MFRVVNCERRAGKDRGGFDRSFIAYERHFDGQVRKKGLFKCGSVWTCPVCAAQEAADRRRQLQRLIDAAGELGVHVALQTLTVRHHRKMQLGEGLAGVEKAYRLLKNRKPWKKFAEQVGLLGTVRTLEVTHGKANGWHVHLHVLLFYTGRGAVVEKTLDGKLLKARHGAALYFAGDLDALAFARVRALRAKKNWAALAKEGDAARIAAEWFDACISAGMEAPSERGAQLQGGKYAASYCAKWGLADEITGASRKKGKGLKEQGDREKNRTPFEILADAAIKNADGTHADPEAAFLWQEFACSFLGRRQVALSKGLAASLGVDFDAEEKAEREKEEPPQILGYIDVETYFGVVVPWDLDEEIILKAQWWGWREVEDFLLSFAPTCPFSVDVKRNRERVEADKLLKAALDGGQRWTARLL